MPKQLLTDKLKRKERIFAKMCGCHLLRSDGNKQTVRQQSPKFNCRQDFSDER